jgi:hypothetical protein
MCIIIYKPAKATLKKETLKTAFENNPDGAGFMYQSNLLEAPKMQKGFFDFDKFYEAYEKVAESDKGYNIAVHFRIATHGAVNSLNCHPFIVKESVEKTISEKGQYSSLFMQNGVIKSISVNKKDKYSDTCNFTYKIMSKIKTLTSMKIKDILETIESPSRFCLMQEGRKPLLIGSFKKDGGVSFSNESYKEIKTAISYPTTFETYLLAFEDCDAKDIRDIETELKDDQCGIIDAYNVGDVTFFETNYLPIREKIAGKEFRCYR